MLIVGIIYIISSTGVVIYKTNCACIGKEQVSVFVTPESCDTKEHQHHKQDNDHNTISCCDHECHECATSENGCGCQSPQTYFFKLINPTVNHEVLFVKAQQPELKVFIACLFSEILFEAESEIIQPISTGPPLVISNSFDFLIGIHQLKIPSVA